MIYKQIITEYRDEHKPFLRLLNFHEDIKNGEFCQYTAKENCELTMALCERLGMKLRTVNKTTSNSLAVSFSCIPDSLWLKFVDYDDLGHSGIEGFKSYVRLKIIEDFGYDILIKDQLDVDKM